MKNQGVNEFFEGRGGDDRREELEGKGVGKKRAGGEEASDIARDRSSSFKFK